MQRVMRRNKVGIDGRCSILTMKDKLEIGLAWMEGKAV